MEQSSGTENESRPAGGVGDAATPSIDGPGRDRSCGSGSRPAEPTLLRAETYDQAQKVGAPVSLSQILGRAPVSSRAPCAAAGPTAPVASSADSTAARNINTMGHGASCLNGRPGAADQTTASPSNNHSVSSFTPLQPTTGDRQHRPDDYAYLCSLVPELKVELKERETRIDALQNETLDLKRRLKKRDDEIGRLQREIHKLKSVLQATGSRPHDGAELLSSLHGANLAVPNSFTKRQGVSGESSDAKHRAGAIDTAAAAPVVRFEKDFRVKQLIKDAVMENDFLKNLDASQVREIVDSMFPREFERGSFVIREGDAGSHLYVSAEGEFEVIQGDKVLGRMGPGKAFGELAILYNCTRTASIKAVTMAKVWALDRRVFQQVMKRTGMQRIDDNLNFLRSVPLLSNLSIDHMSKIADVLEVEFYPAGSYIIRQGARGDNFFIIANGRVKITQRSLGKLEEDEIRTLEKGDYFGEQALLMEEFRTANVIALAPGVECLTLNRDSFNQLIGDLSELREKSYGDNSRGIASSSTSISSRSEVQSEYAHLRLADLDVLATLGVGGFGRVELVQSVFDRTQTFALKCLKKQHIVNTQQQEHIYSEKNIMMACRNPFIARLYNTYRDSKFVYMLMEVCLGGEVWTILRDRGHFEEPTTCFYTACVVEAFDYLHTRNIIYRDLKPENLLLDAHGYVKLVDFGFSKLLSVSNKTWTFCGTPEYVAPEIILNKGHDRAVDYWSLGILMFELLTGTPPFVGHDPMKTYNIILKGIDQIDFPRTISRPAQALIKRLCREVPAERLGYQKCGINDIKNHRWFQGFDWDSLRARTLVAPILPVVKNPSDSSNFDAYPKEKELPPDELSGWDIDF